MWNWTCYQALFSPPSAVSLLKSRIVQASSPFLTPGMLGCNNPLPEDWKAAFSHCCFPLFSGIFRKLCSSLYLLTLVLFGQRVSHTNCFTEKRDFLVRLIVFFHLKQVFPWRNQESLTPSFPVGDEQLRSECFWSLFGRLSYSSHTLCSEDESCSRQPLHSVDSKWDGMAAPAAAAGWVNCRACRLPSWPFHLFPLKTSRRGGDGGKRCGLETRMSRPLAGTDEWMDGLGFRGWDSEATQPCPAPVVSDVQWWLVLL